MKAWACVSFYLSLSQKKIKADKIKAHMFILGLALKIHTKPSWSQHFGPLARWNIIMGN